MHREFDFTGVLVPGVLALLVVSVALWSVLDQVLVRYAVYRRVWHPSLFRLSLFLILFCVLALASRRVLP